MDIVTEVIAAVLIAAGSTIIATKVLLAELKRDVVYLKMELSNVKEEKRNDIAELKAIIKSNNEERTVTLGKIMDRLDHIGDSITGIKVDVAGLKQNGRV